MFGRETDYHAFALGFIINLLLGRVVFGLTLPLVFKICCFGYGLLISFLVSLFVCLSEEVEENCWRSRLFKHGFG